MTTTLANSLITKQDINTLTFYIYVLIKAERGLLSDTCYATINQLVEDCGLKPNRNKGRTNDNVKQALNTLIENELISINKPIENLKPSELFSISLKENSELDSNKCNFAILESDAWVKIKQLEASSKPEILRSYLFIRKNMYDSFSGSPICSSTMRQIGAAAQVASDNTIISILSLIIESNLLYKYQVHYIKNKNIMKRNFFSTDIFDNKMKRICESIATNYNRYDLFKGDSN